MPRIGVPMFFVLHRVYRLDTLPLPPVVLRDCHAWRSATSLKIFIDLDVGLICCWLSKGARTHRSRASFWLAFPGLYEPLRGNFKMRRQFHIQSDIPCCFPPIHDCQLRKACICTLGQYKAHTPHLAEVDLEPQEKGR